MKDDFRKCLEKSHASRTFAAHSHLSRLLQAVSAPFLFLHLYAALIVKTRLPRLSLPMSDAVFPLKPVTTLSSKTGRMI
jgi:hypothetical protein